MRFTLLLRDHRLSPPSGATIGILELQLRSTGISVLGDSLLLNGEGGATSRAGDGEHAEESEPQALLHAQQRSLAHQVFAPAMTRVSGDQEQDNDSGNDDDDASFFGRAALQVGVESHQ